MSINFHRVKPWTQNHTASRWRCACTSNRIRTSNWFPNSWLAGWVAWPKPRTAGPRAGRLRPLGRQRLKKVFPGLGPGARSPAGLAWHGSDWFDLARSGLASWVSIRQWPAGVSDRKTPRANAQPAPTGTPRAQI